MRETDVETYCPAAADCTKMYEWFEQWMDIEGRLSKSPCASSITQLLAPEQFEYYKDVTGERQEDYTEFCLLVKSSVFGQAFGILEAGEMGLFPSIAKAGDDVFEINGACDHCILRATSNPKHTDRDVVLVGACYVHKPGGNTTNAGIWKDYRIH